MSEIPGTMNAQQAAEMTEWLQTPEGEAAMNEHLAQVMRKVYGPPGVKDLMGTAQVDGPSSTFDERIGNCYELGAYALTLGTAPKGTKLVHGTMHGPQAERRISHCWLRLPGGKLWEPITAKVYDEADWTDYADAKVERVYTKVEASKMLVRTGHYGKWHRSRYP